VTKIGMATDRVIATPRRASREAQRLFDDRASGLWKRNPETVAQVLSLLNEPSGPRSKACISAKTRPLGAHLR